MSALVGPGDLAGSLGEMAAERHHLLSVWAAGMLAEASLGLETQPLPRLSHWLGMLLPGTPPLFLSPTQQPMEKGCLQVGVSQDSSGSMISPDLIMGLKSQA